jgi:hypothetical protein
MTRPSGSPFRLWVGGLLAATLALGAAAPLMAANTGTTLLFRPQGATSTVSQGEYISTSLTLASDRYYAYFIEVPPSTPNLRVDIFDPDIGSTHDRTVNSFAASCTYSIRNPAGTEVGSLTRSTSGTNTGNNAWVNLFNTANPTSGHWEVRVTMGSGDDWNGFGLRAHDGVGNEGTAGVELNIYHQPFVHVGVHAGGDSAYLLHPYITSHCDARVHEFDFDEPATGNATPGTADDNGFIRLTSRAGNYIQTFHPLTNNNTWEPPTAHLVTAATRWPSAAAVAAGQPAGHSSSDYGLWLAEIQIDDDVGNTAGQGNYAQVFFTAGTSVPATPTNQTPAGAYRVYFRRDGANGNTPGAAPVKPFVAQSFNHVSGPNPPVAGQVTRTQVEVLVQNPTPFPITFSTPNNIVTTTVPGNLGAGVGTAFFAGSQFATQGTILSTPAIGAGGTVTWNPGTIAAGATARLRYQVDATPATSSSVVRVTGNIASGGTTAVFLDETANSTQPRATFTFGPLCELFLPTPASAGVLLVDLASFDAYSFGDEAPVELMWETAAEYNTVGFNLYREADGAPGEKLTATMIPARGSETSGASYTFTDNDPAPGKSARAYFLEDVEASGRVTLHGPFAVTDLGDDGGELTVDPAVALADLSLTHWKASSIDAFRPADLALDAQALSLRAEPAGGTVPTGYYGAFETRRPLTPIPAGRYLLRAHVEWMEEGAEGTEPPNLRLRVLEEGFSTVWMTEIVNTDLRGKPRPDVVETVWESDGQTAWSVAVDLLGFVEGQAGGFRVTRIENLRLD